MKKRIFQSVAIISTFVVFITFFLTFILLYNHSFDTLKKNLIEETNKLKTIVETNPASLNNAALVSESRVTLIDVNGNVIYDSEKSDSPLDNHADRPEIISALKNGVGSATRISSSTHTKTYYYAIQLKNYEILRLSRNMDNFVSSLYPSIIRLLLLLPFIYLIGLLLTHLEVNRIIQPINNLNLQEPLNNVIYPELRPLLENINEHNAIRREFSANVSHELKTPLTSISGYAEIISTGLVQDINDIKLFSNKIYTEAQSLITMIEDIIKVSRLDEGKLEIKFQPIQFDEIIKSAVTKLTPYATKKSITIIERCKPVSGAGIKTVIEEMIYNLIQNAIKYNKPNGHVWVFLYEYKNRIVIEVKDDGIGISSEDLPRIFERFFRADKSHNQTIEGSGLGLAIVKHSVQLHQGEITVNSKLNHGTEFKIFLNKH